MTSVGWFIQRYWPSVLFPSSAAWAIYADWSHTQEWKKQQKEKQVSPPAGFYFGMILDDSETQRMTRYRDRSALYGRPPPPPGVKEIPSW